jgi:integrase
VAPGRWREKEYVSTFFRRACSKAGLSHYRFHDLRYTFNTNMVNAGVDQSTVMNLTGHKTLAMSLRYSHVDREQGEAAMAKLGEFLGGKGNAVRLRKKEERGG